MVIRLNSIKNLRSAGTIYKFITSRYERIVVPHIFIDLHAVVNAKNFLTEFSSYKVVYFYIFDNAIFSDFWKDKYIINHASYGNSRFNFLLDAFHRLLFQHLWCNFINVAIEIGLPYLYPLHCLAG